MTGYFDGSETGFEPGIEVLWKPFTTGTLARRALDTIEAARVAYGQGDLKRGLARHHDDVDSAFLGWNRIWLDPAFRHWNITAEVARIDVPLLAVQGLDDVYGTLEQIRGIQRLAPQTQLLELAACGHSPHRDQPAALIAAATAFIKQHTGDRT